MRVDPSRVSNAGAAEVKKSGGTAKSEPAKDKKSVSAADLYTGQGMRAEISPKAKEAAQAKSLAAAAPDVREDRVADLKRRIADGSYKVNADAVADRLVSEHLTGAPGA